MSQWFHPQTVNTGWDKNLKAGVRRKRMLRAHLGDVLSSAKACNALGNVTRDKATERAARADAKYFFRMNEKQGRTLKSVD